VSARAIVSRSEEVEERAAGSHISTTRVSMVATGEDGHRSDRPGEALSSDLKKKLTRRTLATIPSYNVKFLAVYLLCTSCYICFLALHLGTSLPSQLSSTVLCPLQISAAIGIWLCRRILSVRQPVHNLWQFFVLEDYHWKCYHIFTTTPLTLNRHSCIQPSRS